MEHISPEGEWITPSCESSGYEFTYQNTRIRLFSDQWEHLNHVQWTDDEGNAFGMRVTQDFMDYLMENEYPYSFDYFPDNQDIEWWVAIQATEMESELGEAA